MNEAPQRPERVEPSPEKKRGSLIPLVLAFLLGLAAFVALLFLTLGAFAYVAAAGLMMFLVAAFHYLVWGRWLERIVRAEVEAEERLEREQAARDAEGLKAVAQPKEP